MLIFAPIFLYMEQLRALIVCSGNKGRVNPFISEQVDALSKIGVITEYYIIKGKGIKGYLTNMLPLHNKIREGKFDIIHAHYGLSGLLSAIQRKVPVITTFHGSDIHQKSIRRLSWLAAKLSAHSILVEKSFIDKLKLKKNYTVLPCGIDLKVFTPVERNEARKQMKYDPAEQLVLFASSFDNKVKNYGLARSAVGKLPGIRLIELKSYTRQEINLLMNAADALLLTSFKEGSPQVVKEAMACNLPVIATAVGDVPEIVEGIPGNHIVPYDPDVIADALKNVLDQKIRPANRPRILGYDNIRVAKIIRKIYYTSIKKIPIA